MRKEAILIKLFHSLTVWSYKSKLCCLQTQLYLKHFKVWNPDFFKRQVCGIQSLDLCKTRKLIQLNCPTHLNTRIQIIERSFWKSQWKVSSWQMVLKQSTEFSDIGRLNFSVGMDNVHWTYVNVVRLLPWSLVNLLDPVQSMLGQSRSFRSGPLIFQRKKVTESSESLPETFE